MSPDQSRDTSGLSEGEKIERTRAAILDEYLQAVTRVRISFLLRPRNDQTTKALNDLDGIRTTNVKEFTAKYISNNLAMLSEMQVNFADMPGIQSDLVHMRAFLSGLLVEKLNTGHIVNNIQGLFGVSVKRLLDAIGVHTHLNR